MTTKNKKYFKIKFVLVQVVHDNLGVNTVLGFIKFVSTIFFVDFVLVTKHMFKALLLKIQIYLAINQTIIKMY